MPIYIGTRYVNSEVIAIKGIDGRVKLSVDRSAKTTEDDATYGFFYYSTKPGETIWQIAHKFALSERYFAILCDLNEIIDPFESIAERTLRIPYELKSIRFK